MSSLSVLRAHETLVAPGLPFDPTSVVCPWMDVVPTAGCLDAASPMPYVIPIDVILSVVDESDFETLLSWRFTTKTLYDYVTSKFKRRYDTLMETYFSDVDAFNQLLLHHHAVISGSVALRFFLDDAKWEPGDLDVYVQDSHFEQLLDRLKADPRLDCIQVYDSNDEAGAPPGLLGIPEYAVKQVVRLCTDQGMHLDLVRSFDNCSVSPLLEFWSTLLANFITPLLFACLYPRYTLDWLSVQKVGYLSPSDREAIQKYRTRGFEMSQDRYWVCWGYELNCASQIAGDNAVVASMDPLTVSGADSSPIVRATYGWFLNGFGQDQSQWRLGCPAVSVIPVSVPALGYDGVLEIEF